MTSTDDEITQTITQIIKIRSIDSYKNISFYIDTSEFGETLKLYDVTWNGTDGDIHQFSFENNNTIPNGSLDYYNGKWVSYLLKNINSTQAYTIENHNNEEFTLTYKGKLSTTRIIKGLTQNSWSEIGYPINKVYKLDNKLIRFIKGELNFDLNPSNGDIIKSTSEFSMYSNGEWYGSLKYLEPGKGYKYYNKSTNFRFNYVFDRATEETNTDNVKKDYDIDFNPYQFKYSATMILSLSY